MRSERHRRPCCGRGDEGGRHGRKIGENGEGR